MRAKRDDANETNQPASFGTVDLPIGSVVMWTDVDAPTGWLSCDGSIYEQAEFPQLYDVVGHSFGDLPKSKNYDPATQFFVPDLRGRFIRGVDGGAGRDPDAAKRTDMQSGKTVGDQIGSVQEDELKEHDHEYFSSLLGADPFLFEGQDFGGGPSFTALTGGPETRPKNAYLYFIIKAR